MQGHSSQITEAVNANLTTFEEVVPLNQHSPEGGDIQSSMSQFGSTRTSTNWPRDLELTSRGVKKKLYHYSRRLQYKETITSMRGVCIPNSRY